MLKCTNVISMLQDFVDSFCICSEVHVINADKIFDFIILNITIFYKICADRCFTASLLYFFELVHAVHAKLCSVLTRSNDYLSQATNNNYS